MKRILLFSVILMVPQLARTQSDPEAIRILDRFSATALSAPSVSMKFNAVTTDQLEGITDTIPGSIVLSKDKYRLDLIDNMIWFNGETSWNYLPAENEVTITKPDRNDDSFMSRPSSIFTMYKKGYKNRLVEDTSDRYIIDLYPEDLKSDLIRIRLTIGKPSLNIRAIEYKNKNGLTITLLVTDYDLKQKPDPSLFTFQPGKYKGIEIVDMR
ncbi:MAG: outer membrane lipoprotein carrier protein LolA [Bacteroidales bacterium]|nr:outer membrane lipoprotein carrier protein LolA [Bacteroidales bacterium]